MWRAKCGCGVNRERAADAAWRLASHGSCVGGRAGPLPSGPSPSLPPSRPRACHPPCFASAARSRFTPHPHLARHMLQVSRHAACFFSFVSQLQIRISCLSVWFPTHSYSPCVGTAHATVAFPIPEAVPCIGDTGYCRCEMDTLLPPVPRCLRGLASAPVRPSRPGVGARPALVCALREAGRAASLSGVPRRLTLWPSPSAVHLVGSHTEE